MNAQVTGAAVGSCGGVPRGTPPSAEASGFQSLFATATGKATDADVGRSAAVVAGGVAASGRAVGPSNQKMRSEEQPGDDTAGLTSAMAAGLVMPVAAAPCENGVGDVGTTFLDGRVAVEASATAGGVAGSGADAEGTGLESRSGVAAALPEAQGIGAASGMFEVTGAEHEAEAADAADADVAATGDGPAAKSGDEMPPAAAKLTRDSEAVARKVMASRQKQDVSQISNAAPGTVVAALAQAGGQVIGAEDPPSPAARTIRADEIGAVPVVGSTVHISGTVKVPDVQNADGKTSVAGDRASALQRAEADGVASPSISGSAEELTLQRRFIGESRGRTHADPDESDGASKIVGDRSQSAPSSPVPMVPAAMASAEGRSLASHTRFPSPPNTEQAVGQSAAPQREAPTPVLPVLHTGQVLQRMDRAEIRIGLQSEDFGAIRLRTTVANDQVDAAVSTSHAGLRDALLVEAPSLEKAMGRHSLRLDGVNVDAGTSQSNYNSFGSNEHHERRTGPAEAPMWLGRSSQPRQATAMTAAVPGPSGDRRLDVRA